jgi:membrane peptidoglycan carboxypeptidase
MFYGPFGSAKTIGGKAPDGEVSPPIPSPRRICPTCPGQAAALPARAAGGKTVTSRDSRDAWFIGCTGGLIIGIWRGNDDSHPMRDVVGEGSLARLFAAIAAGG